MSKQPEDSVVGPSRRRFIKGVGAMGASAILEVLRPLF